MAGSSAFQFGRAAYKAGPGQPPGAGARRVGERPVPPARLDGRRHRRAARADRPAAGGRARARPAAARAGRARRRAAAAVPEDARDRLRAPGRGPPDLHLHRRLAGDGGADGDRAHLRRRGRLGLRGRRRAVHRPRGRAVHLPRGQGAGDPRAGRARGHRPRARRGRTPTRSPTCRCCAPSATRSRSTRTRSSRASRARRAGRCCASTGSGGGCASARPRWAPRRSAGIGTRALQRARA